MLSFHQLSIENFDVTRQMAEEMARKQQKRDKTALKRSGSNSSPRSMESDNTSRSGSRSADGGGGSGRKARAAGGSSSKSNRSSGNDADGGIATTKTITARPKIRRVRSTAAVSSPATSPPSSVVPRTSCDGATTAGKTSSSSAGTTSTVATTETTLFSSVTAPAPPAFLHTMIVDRTWQQIKGTVPHYEEWLGEQIILRMIELDPTARTKMSLTSLRSSPNNTRFSELSQILVDLVELMVSLVGPDSDLEEYQEEFQSIQKKCKAEGIQVTLLSVSVSHAVQQLLMGDSKNDESGNTSAQSQEEEPAMAWKKVIEFVAFKVQQELPEE